MGSSNSRNMNIHNESNNTLVCILNGSSSSYKFIVPSHSTSTITISDEVYNAHFSYKEISPTNIPCFSRWLNDSSISFDSEHGKVWTSFNKQQETWILRVIHINRRILVLHNQSNKSVRVVCSDSIKRARKGSSVRFEEFSDIATRSGEMLEIKRAIVGHKEDKTGPVLKTKYCKGKLVFECVDKDNDEVIVTVKDEIHPLR